MSKRAITVAAAFASAFAVLLWWVLPKAKGPVNTSPSTVSSLAPQTSSGPGSESDPVEQTIEGIVARYRKTIVLLEDDPSLSDTDKDKASLVGKIIFQENHQAISSLSTDLTAEIQNAADFTKTLPHLSRFLDLLEGQQDLHDADKLAFREIIADLAESLSADKQSTSAKQELEGRIDEDRKALSEIQSLYEKEFDKIFGRFETRGIPVRREAWERYVAYLHTKYKRGDILKDYEATLSRLQVSVKDGHKDNDLETYGTTLPPKTLVLTFDDGPHPRYTDRILEILKQNQVRSVFFELGSNLTTLKQNKPEPTRASAAARRLVEAGYEIGSHGFSHTLLPTMTDKDVATELDETTHLLETVVHVHPVLFRPPYGGRDLKVLAAIDAHKMKSVLWNIDSRDWADPIAKSIANRVIGDARRYGHGIILLHDIHERTIEALPLIIETLKGEGYRFVSWNGQAFAADTTEITLRTATDTPLTPYHDSWAVLIGIDNYPKWPKLQYAVNDANGMKEILIRKFHFKPDHIITLLNQEATREGILSALGDTLSNPKSVQRDDRVLVFFAGHGATRKLPSGRDLGYIVPYDADSENFQGQSISMTNFQDISESIPAKHVFFIMDSCYSGLAITRGVASDNYIREVSKRPARQMLTAGGADEEVADNGPNGHSVFTWTVLQGLEGRADLNSDGFITAAELAAYVAPSVSALSHQTPAFGNLPGSEGGEFLFQLGPSESEFLSNLSTQLDQEAIELNAELDRIRKEVAAKTARNEQLRVQLAAARSQVGKPGTVTPPEQKATGNASSHLNEGEVLFREKRYPEALGEFLTAAKMNPQSARALNNAGFMYYKLGNLDEAIKWTQKAITIDPQRSIAYKNLADLYYELNKPEEARPNYQKYLELDPHSPDAARIKARLGTNR